MSCSVYSLFLIFSVFQCIECGIISYSLIWQKTPFPGIQNQISAVFMTNSDLESSDGSFLNISGLQGADPAYAKPAAIPVLAL